MGRQSIEPGGAEVWARLRSLSVVSFLVVSLSVLFLSACSLDTSVPSDIGDDAGIDSIGCEPSTEVCNDVDDDCDSMVDEGFALGGDTENCGGCGVVCPSGDRSRAVCNASECELACEPGFSDCDDDPSTGCEADLSAGTTCGSCDQTCSGTTPNCSGGSCVDGCDAGETLCGTSCVDTSDTAAHCGGCGDGCDTDPGEVAVCVDSECQVVCADDFYTCSSGCEEPSELHCGACDDPCEQVNSTNACVAETCVPACLTNFGDCDDEPRNGCETDLRADPAFCGSCARSCSPTQLCVDSDCVTETVEEICLGFNFGCARSVAGRVYCWGTNTVGQLGNGTTDLGRTASRNMVPDGASALTCGQDHACAVVDGDIYCWGRGANGRLGNGRVVDVRVPERVTGITNATQVAVGSQHSCALLEDDTVQCWGLNSLGQLGRGGRVDSLTPVAVNLTDVDEDPVQISLGTGYSCLLTEVSGDVYCWGQGSHGRTGVGDQLRRETPTFVRTGIQQISAGHEHACAVTRSNGISCWGNNGVSQVGAVGALFLTPTDVAAPSSVEQISAGRQHSCATTITGSILCWGLNGDQQAIDSTATPIPSPQGRTVPGGGFTVAAIARHRASCMLNSSGSVYCWGDGGAARLGDGLLAASASGTQVVGLPPFP